MRLPQHLLNSKYFSFDSCDELISAMGEGVDPAEATEMRRLGDLGLPPITSQAAISVLLGINKGLTWSLVSKPQKYYRTFSIPKGRGVRVIQAPKIALKIFQTWIAFHLQERFSPPQHVFGFVPGRSHILAANEHCGARWIYSVDVRNYFQSTPQEFVSQALCKLGYGAESAKLVGQLTCLGGALAQGSPASPVLSNMCFQELDEQFLNLASKFGARLTRYADDLVFSGHEMFPEDLKSGVAAIFEKSPWVIAPEKTEFLERPKRLKVHGLLVHGENVRLTKGYRNRIRALRHLDDQGKLKPDLERKARGHLSYAAQVEKISNRST